MGLGIHAGIPRALPGVIGLIRTIKPIVMIDKWGCFRKLFPELVRIYLESSKNRVNYRTVDLSLFPMIFDWMGFSLFRTLFNGLK